MNVVFLVAHVLTVFYPFLSFEVLGKQARKEQDQAWRNVKNHRTWSSLTVVLKVKSKIDSPKRGTVLGFLVLRIQPNQSARPSSCREILMVLKLVSLSSDTFTATESYQ